jgi:hypothetical protein
LRPSEILMMALGVVVGLSAIAFGVYAFVERPGGEPWFHWIAPLVMLLLGGVAIMLVGQYYMRVGRLAMKGRPRK